MPEPVRVGWRAACASGDVVCSQLCAMFDQEELLSLVGFYQNGCQSTRGDGGCNVAPSTFPCPTCTPTNAECD